VRKSRNFFPDFFFQFSRNTPKEHVEEVGAEKLGKEIGEEKAKKYAPNCMTLWPLPGVVVDVAGPRALRAMSPIMSTPPTYTEPSGTEKK